jgi:hypothetical protein
MDTETMEGRIMKLAGCFPRKITWGQAQVGDLLFITSVLGGVMTAVIMEKEKNGAWLQQLSWVSPQGEILDGAAGVSLRFEDAATVYLLGRMPWIGSKKED